MTDATNALPLADVSDMAMIHGLFRTALARRSKLVGDVADGDAERAQLAGAYYSNVLRLLHAHHAGEDELMTPWLLERCPENAELISRVAAQHDVVHADLARVEALLPTWQEAPTPAVTSQLAEALARLEVDLCEHLDAEEASIVPLAGRCLNVAEWGELPAHAFQHFDGDRLWLILGLVREHLSGAHRDGFDANMPPPVAQMWADSGQRLYTDFMAELLTA